MKSDNLTQLSGLLIIDVITNEKKSFAAFTIGRKVGEDTLYMNSIAFPNLKFKIPFDILTLGNSIFVAGYLNSNKHIEGVSIVLQHSMSERTFKDLIKTAIFKKLDYGTYEKCSVFALFHQFSHPKVQRMQSGKKTYIFTLIFIIMNLIYLTIPCELSKICIFAMQTHIKMKKSFYRTDYLFSKGSFLTGMGSILSIFAPFYTFNGSRSEKQADRTAIESDFGVIGQDIYSVLRSYKF